MLDVFLCHAPADREIAERIKARLDRGAEANVWMEPCGRDTPQTMAVAWEGGSSSAAILLLLSPDAIPQRMRREDWQPLLEHLEGNAEPPICGILLDACPYPPLLERRRFLRWNDGATATLRKIERWVMGLHPGEPTFLPAALPQFEARGIDEMWTALVDEPGTSVVVDDPNLAQEFARAASGHFRDIVWIGCGDRSPRSVAGEIASQFRSSVEGVLGVMRSHRLLLVLDDLRGPLPFEFPQNGRTSVLVITRPLERDRFKCSEAPADARELALWEAMSVCRPQDIRLELAAQIANMDEIEARVIAGRLVARRCVDPMDTAGTRFRLLTGPSNGHAPHRRHAEVLNEAFQAWSTHPARCTNCLPEIEAALEWAMASDWSLATRLAGRAAAFLKSECRVAEAAQIYARLREVARERQDAEVVDDCSWELSWIHDEEGEIRPVAAGADQMGFDF